MVQPKSFLLKDFALSFTIYQYKPSTPVKPIYPGPLSIPWYLIPPLWPMLPSHTKLAFILFSTESYLFFKIQYTLWLLSEAFPRVNHKWSISIERRPMEKHTDFLVTSLRICFYKAFYSSFWKLTFLQYICCTYSSSLHFSVNIVYLVVSFPSFDKTNGGFG